MAACRKPIPDPTARRSRSLPGLGWTNWQATSYVVSEPVGAGTWYPVNDEPTDKASYRFTITVDKPYVAVANGVPLSVTDLGQAAPLRLGAGAAHGELSRDHRRRPYRLEQRHSASGVPIRNYLTTTTPAETLAHCARHRR